MSWMLCFLLTCLAGFVRVVPSSACLVGCICQSSQGSNKLRADCTGRGFKDIITTNFIVNITDLDLSNNDITTIRTKAFSGYKTLKKLDLSNNKIAHIDAGAFSGLSRVTKLDLSSNDLTELNGLVFKGLKSLKQLILRRNRLNFVNGTAFTGLRRLRRLDLSSNRFITFPEGTLNQLSSLRTLDLSSNDLLCDCQLRWLIKYKKLNRKLSLRGTCQYPKALENRGFAKTKAKAFTCGKLQLPFYTFQPQNSLVVMYGDSIALTCGTTWIPGLRINWYKNSKLLIPGTKGKPWKISFKTNDRENQVVSLLQIAKLNTTDSGKYQCNVSTTGSFILGEARLNVLFGNSKFCRAEVTKTSKGEFRWENTDIGVIARLECPAGSSRADPQGDAVATRACSNKGVWLPVVDKWCAYDDPLTQRLFGLNQIGVNSSIAMAVTKALLNITSHASRFTTAQDVIYSAKILRRIQAHASAKEKIAEAIVEVVSNLMNVKKELLAAAQNSDKSCSSLIVAVDQLAGLGTSFLLQRTASNIGVDIVHIFPAAFQGKTCAAFFNDKNGFKSTLCNLPWKNVTAFTQSRPLEASIHLPPYVFGKRASPMERRKMTFTVYRNSSLFPNMRNGSLQDDRMRVISSVSCLQFDMGAFNITSSIAVKFRNHQTSKEPTFVAYWDKSGQGGHGIWLNNTSCTISKDEKFTVASCTRLEEKTCFAIMELVKKPAVVALSGDDNGVLIEPIVYIGAAVCVLLLLITLLTYIIFRQLRYNRHDAAMLMNQCLALVVVVIIFVSGVYRTGNPLMCRAIAVLLHYFLLCCLFWVGCGGLCLCRLIRTTLQPEEFNPVLRYYMISWGIPLIICGITVAGNPENYHVVKYCWLEPNPFLGAFVGPACLVIVIDIFMYFRLHNLVKRTYALQKREQETSEPVAQNTEEHLSEAVTSKCELIENIQALPDKEEIQSYQNGSLLVLLLIIVNFTLGFLIVRFRVPKYLNLALSCVFAVTLILLGLVVFLFQCYKNPKARKFWTKCFRKHSCTNKKYILDQEEVENLDAPPETGKLMNGDAVRNGNASESPAHRLESATSTIPGTDAQPYESLLPSAVVPVYTTLTTMDSNDENGMVENRSADLHSLTIGSDKLSVTAGSDKHSVSTTVSDKNSCASAPLPFGHALPKLREHPPGYRYSYHVPDEVEFKRVKPKQRKRTRKAPIALPERNGITSSLESSLRQKEGKKDNNPSKMLRIDSDIPESTVSEIGTSEVAPSELSSIREPARFLEPPSLPISSCASSEVSAPVVSGDIMQKRPPIPGAPNDSTVPMAMPPVRGKPPLGRPPMDKYPYGVFGPRGGGSLPPSFRMPGYPNMPFPRGVNYPPRFMSMPGYHNGEIRHPIPRIPHNDNRNEDHKHAGEEQRPPGLNLPSSPNGPFMRFPPPRPDQNGPSGPSTGVPRHRSPDHVPSDVLSNEQLRRRTRDRSSSDRGRTSRRNKEGGSLPRTKDPSEGGPKTKPSRYGSRTSQLSCKDERPKPEPKEWVADRIARVNYVPIPHLISDFTKQPDRCETSV